MHYHKPYPKLQLMRPDLALYTVKVSNKSQGKTPSKEQESLPIIINPEQKQSAKTSSNDKQHQSKSEQLTPNIPIQQSPKVNAVVSQINSTKNEIQLLKARINRLKNDRASNEKRAFKSLDAVARITATRERIQQQHKFEEIITERRLMETSMRKTRNNSFRIEIKNNLDKAKKKIEQQKIEKAEEQRQVRKEDEEYIAELKDLDKKEKMLKALTVKKFEEQHQFKMQYLIEASRIRSHQNHLNRFYHCKKEKSKIDQILENLKKEEEQIRSQAERSVVIMLQAENKLKQAQKGNKVSRISKSGFHRKSNLSFH